MEELMNLKQRREVFKKVASHLLKQNRRASHGGNCVYRASNGDTCAVGCLIKDEDYSPIMENYTVDSNNVKPRLERSLGVKIEPKDLGLLGELQQLHDHAPIEEWKPRLNYIAKIYKLVKLK